MSTSLTPDYLPQPGEHAEGATQLTPSPEHPDDMATLFTRAAQLLADHGGYAASVQYSGSGDSSDGYSLMFLDANGEPIEIESSDVEEALTTATEQAIDAAGYDGFEINEGGFGKFYLRIDGYAGLEHQDNTVESSTYEYDFVAQSLPERLEHHADLIPQIAQKLAAHNLQSICIQYAGGGDSGGVEHVELVSQDGQALDTGNLMTTLDAIGHLSVNRFQHAHDPAHGWVKIITPIEATLSEAFEAFLWDAIDACEHRGWENNEGGDGYATLNADGTLSLSHTDHYEGSSEPERNIWQFPAAAIEPAPAYDSPAP